ncbi:hypothetical protein ACFL1B_00965 [Nanoarchaeota archaeon]
MSLDSFITKLMPLIGKPEPDPKDFGYPHYKRSEISITLKATPERDNWVVILPNWNGGRLMDRFVNKLHKAGNSVLHFEYPAGVLSPAPAETMNNFLDLEDYVKRQIDTYSRWMGFSEYTIIGLSLGNVPATRIANQDERATKLVLNYPGHSLAEAVWRGHRTQKLRAALEGQGYGLDYLNVFWEDLAPGNNVDNLQGKEIIVRLSRADEIIPYYTGVKLVNAMKRASLSPEVQVNNLGHYLSCARELLSPRT